MKTHQKALLVTSRPGQTHDLDTLNQALNRGWRVAHATAMGGAGVGAQNGLPELCFAALVIIERDDDDAEALLAQAEKVPEEHLDNPAEGDGAGIALEELGVDLDVEPSEASRSS